MLPLRHEKRWRLAGITLLLIVTVAAITPELPFWPRASSVVMADKWLHALTFLFLSLWFAGQYRPASYWRLLIGLTAFGVLIELGQSMISYRSAQWTDVAADLLGIAVGLVIAVAGLGGWSLRFEQWLERDRVGVD